MEIEGLFIELWSGSAGYRQRCWLRVLQVDELATLVNIEAEYPALADHEEIA